MTWVATAIAGVGLFAKGVGAIGKGYAAEGFDSSQAVDAAERIKLEREALLRRETQNQIQSTRSQYALATENILNQLDESSGQSSSNLLKIFREREMLSQKTGGLASVGVLDTMTSESKGSVREGHERTLDKLSLQQKGVYEDMRSGLTGIDISRERSLAGIQERFDARISEIGAMPDTFWEGAFGYSDFRIKGREDLYG